MSNKVKKQNFKQYSLPLNIQNEDGFIDLYERFLGNNIVTNVEKPSSFISHMIISSRPGNKFLITYFEADEDKENQIETWNSVTREFQIGEIQLLEFQNVYIQHISCYNGNKYNLNDKIDLCLTSIE